MGYGHDRAMAKWSTRSEQNRIGFRALDYFCHLRSCPFIQVPQSLTVAHKSQVFVTHAPNNSGLCQFTQPVNREDTIDIFISMTMIVVFVCDHQLTRLDITWNKPPAIIPLFVKRFLVT